MKAIKSLLAVSIFTAAGAANAATIVSFDVSDTYTIYTNSTLITPRGTGSMLSPVTADLSDTGVLSITGLTQKFFTSTGAQQYHATASMTLTGTIDLSGGTFTVANVSTTTQGCLADLNGGCVAVNGTKTLAIPSAEQAIINLWAPSTSSFVDSQCVPGQCNLAWNVQTFSFTAKTFAPCQPEGCSVTVIQQPIPSAAWLFGSGLIGITGLVRRRRVV